MKQLSYDDVLELLGYRKSERHPFEILGYEYSSAGVLLFRLERPDFLPQVLETISKVLEKCGRWRGRFPFEPTNRGVFIEGTGSSYLFHYFIEVSFHVEPKITHYHFAEDAALALVRSVGNPDYLPSAFSAPLNPLGDGT